jgi:hypothetical protein
VTLVEVGQVKSDWLLKIAIKRVGRVGRMAPKRV